MKRFFALSLVVMMSVLVCSCADMPSIQEANSSSPHSRNSTAPKSETSIGQSPSQSETDSAPPSSGEALSGVLQITGWYGDSGVEMHTFSLSPEQIQSFMPLYQKQEYTIVGPANDYPGSMSRGGYLTIQYDDGTSGGLGLLMTVRDGNIIVPGKGSDDLMSFLWNLEPLKSWEEAYYFVNMYVDTQARKGIPCSVKRFPIPEGKPAYPYGVATMRIQLSDGRAGIDVPEEQIQAIMPLFFALKYEKVSDRTISHDPHVSITYTNGEADSFSLDLQSIGQYKVRVTQGGDELMSTLWSLDALQQTGLAPQFINAYIDRQESQGIPCTLERLPES